MSRLLAIILAAIVALSAAADRTTRSRLKVKKPAVTAVNFAEADTLWQPADSLLVISGYEKPLDATWEALLVTNHLPDGIKGLNLSINYLDLNGHQLHKVTRTIQVACPAGQTRKVRFSSWDRNRSYFYHRGRQPRTSGVTPYTVAIRVNFALL